MFKVRPAVMARLLAGQYSQPTLAVIVRELLQNAWDAQVAAGVETPISLEIGVHNSRGKITCRDSGPGMSLEDVEEYLLTLGASGKQQGIGGFGVAAALILTYPATIRTRDLILRSDGHALQVERTSDFLPGTEITVTDVPAERMAWHLTTAMLLLEDIPSRITIQGHGIVTPGPINEIRRIGSGANGPTSWVVRLISPLSVSIGGDEVTTRGVVAYRLGGLVQFLDIWSSAPDTVVVDLHTTARPGEREYPLTPSREAIADPEIGSAIRRVVRDYLDNPLTTRAPAPPPVYRTVWSGRWWPNSPCDSCEGSRPSPIGILTTVYRPYPPSPLEWRILEGWKEILARIHTRAGISSQFSIGILPTEHPARAECAFCGVGRVEYRLNTGYLLSLPTRAIPLVLAHLAVHEAAHIRYPSHGEMHAAEMGYLAEFLDAQDIQEISAIIRGKRSHSRGNSREGWEQSLLPLDPTR